MGVRRAVTQIQLTLLNAQLVQRYIEKYLEEVEAMSRDSFLFNRLAKKGSLDRAAMMKRKDNQEQNTILLPA